MKLDRNINSDGTGKYALVRLRRLRELNNSERVRADDALAKLHSLGVLTYGNVGTPDEFFPILLKDKHAERALVCYAMSAAETDTEYANEIYEMTNRAGPNNPWCKDPD